MGCRNSKERGVEPSFDIVRHNSGKLHALNSPSVTSKESLDSDSDNNNLPTTSAGGESSSSNRRQNIGCLELFSGSIAASVKDQDRFITVPELLPNVFFTGVFDGHGQSGALFAERAAKLFARLLHSKISWMQDIAQSKETKNTEDLEKLRVKALKDLSSVFSDIQKIFTAEYERDVKAPLEKARKAMEKSEGISLPLSLPMIGGTTATIILVAGDLLFVAWVGDSRAVVGCVVESETGSMDDVIESVNLTVDHNVEANESERNRAIGAGGAVAGRYIAVDGAEGMLQVTRSLGDVPHHTNNIVSSVPEVRVLKLSPSKNPFVVLASDGIWHHRSSTQVIKELYTNLTEVVRKNESERSNETAGMTDEQLLGTCQDYELKLIEWVKQNSAQNDDIVMSVFTVRGYPWSKK